MKKELFSEMVWCDENSLVTLLDRNYNHILTCPRDAVEYIDITGYGNVGGLFVTYDEQNDAYITDL